MIESVIYSFVFSFVLITCLMPYFIRYMHSLCAQGQPIREVGPQTHFAKQGTPTMGGVLILFVILLTCFIFASMKNPYVLLTLFVLSSFGFIGFQDDFGKLKKHSSNSGITGRRRLFSEFLIACIAIVFSLNFLPPEFSTKIHIPVIHYWLPLGVLYVAFASFVTAGTTNAVNLTDGLDGLVSLPLIFVFIFMSVLAWLCSDSLTAATFQLGYIPGINALCPVASAAIGSLCGFLIFNHKPAKIFMGDVGALGLGGMVAMMGILTKSEVLFGVVCLLFVIEAVSVMIQVYVYKRTGKRIFLMTPIHHHFEKKGWSEQKVVFVFWMFALCMLISGFIIGAI